MLSPPMLTGFYCWILIMLTLPAGFFLLASIVVVAGTEPRKQSTEKPWGRSQRHRDQYRDFMENTSFYSRFSNNKNVKMKVAFFFRNEIPVSDFERTTINSQFYRESIVRG